ncbi:thiosulfate/3-mercaptopyruvate sulfurtransferase [Kribbella aluminosa]|uniref:Thiosulfate/3-mercaptopyruvate sulfurtransferase n=1 Tax=Kribbella aluminosa TaxID=416017 RepID=A0ABS4UMU9_9ACTN|nr:sulfurtransferase [Kribbella aluminosa]MBP2352966.1 thiosulfate/3-mercaptopyruvate sulfurtransferase [Kribbella aluminosa]
MSPLITVEELRALGTAPVLADVTWNLAGPPGKEAYDAGHLPGAYFVDLDTELAGPPGPGRHPLPDATTVTAIFHRLGITSADTPVVVYDAATSMSAARAWWTFRYFGLTNVRVLNGGQAAWQAAGEKLTTEVPPASAGTGSAGAAGGAVPVGFVATPGHLPVLDAEGAAAAVGRGILLDARAPERYAGEVEPMDPVAGHIPGAVNAPTGANVNESGHFLPPAELRARFSALGVTDGTEVAVYCGSGVTAAHEALALESAGIPATVYIGSWSEWVTNPTRPVATGS